MPLLKVRKSARAQFITSPFRSKSEEGFTLLEIALVMLIIGVVSAVAVSRFNSVSVWRQQSDLRKFLNTWQFLHNEALNRGEGYRLIINLDERSYRVYREVPNRTTTKQVDLLENLRLDSEKERRTDQEKEQQVLSASDAAKEEDIYQGGNLENLFYNFLYSDLTGNTQLTDPLEFPSLAERVTLGENVDIEDITVGKKVIDRGSASIRFSPRGGSDYAVIHMRVGEQAFTAFMDPASGEMNLTRGPSH